jgi:hypothetical protein
MHVHNCCKLVNWFTFPFNKQRKYAAFVVKYIFLNLLQLLNKKRSCIATWVKQRTLLIFCVCSNFNKGLFALPDTESTDPGHVYNHVLNQYEVAKLWPNNFESSIHWMWLNIYVVISWQLFMHGQTLYYSYTKYSYTLNTHEESIKVSVNMVTCFLSLCVMYQCVYSFVNVIH